MSLWEIQRLDQSHDRTCFACGEEPLDTWLKERAGQFERKDLSRTYVACKPESKTVCGYYAIATHRVLYESLTPESAKGLPRIDVPVVLLGRLAVDQKFQGLGLGAILLVDALKRAMLIANEIGVRAVEVDAIHDVARAFYLKFGFRSLLDDPKHLFMPMHEIRKLGLG